MNRWNHGLLALLSWLFLGAILPRCAPPSEALSEPDAGDEVAAAGADIRFLAGSSYDIGPELGPFKLAFEQHK